MTTNKNLILLFYYFHDDFEKERYNSYLYYEGNKTVVLLPVCGSRKSFGSRGFLAGRDCQELAVETCYKNPRLPNV